MNGGAVQSRLGRCLSVFAILLFGVGLIMPLNLYADLAKIHRKNAKLTLEPQVILQGRKTVATVQPFAPGDYFTAVMTPDGQMMLREDLKTSETTARVLDLPEGLEENHTVVAGIQYEDSYDIVAFQPLTVLPDYLANVTAVRKRLEAVENKAGSDPVLLRGAWAALAYCEDLLERAKAAEPGDVYDLKERLDALRQKADGLEKGTDPLRKEEGYQLRGYRSPLNNEIQLYSFYLPENYDETKPWPLVVMLHGAWSNHHLAMRRVFGKTNNPGEDDAAAKRSMPELPKVPYLVVAPNGYETMSYEGFAEEDVWRVIDEVKTLYNVDPDRVYLTGLSMGGAGTGKIGLRHPDAFAAIAPVCGFFGRTNNRPGQPEKTDCQLRLEAMAAPHEIAENALHLPVKLMHGDKDPVVPVENTYRLHERLKELGYSVEMEIYPGVEHDAWEPAYKDARIFEWFAQYKRNPFPEKVILKTGDPAGASAYWVQIDEPAKIREFARVEAQALPDRIEVKTENVERLTIRVPAALFAGKDSVKIYLDGQFLGEGAFHGDTQNYRNESGRWTKAAGETKPRLLPSSRGIYAALLDKHVYSFGVGTRGDNRETRRAAVEEAANLARMKSMTLLLHDVQWNCLADIYVDNPADQNLVLFSEWDTSKFLEKYAEKLPVKFTEQGLAIGGRTVKKDQGLVFIYPNPANPDRYILVCTAFSVEGLKALRTFASGTRSLFIEVPGDILIFNPDGSTAACGLFDKNWQVESLDPVP